MPPSPRDPVPPQAISAALAPGQQKAVKQGAQATIDRIVPILQVDMRPTNVDPRSVGGVKNMKRVLHVVLNSESASITAKDEDGRSLGVTNFRQIYPSIQGPDADGAMQVEYHEQATLGWVGDVMWSMGWFFKHGILGVPHQSVSIVLQSAGVSFVLETYYARWLASLLDQMHQQGLLPGYTDPETHSDLWEIATETMGRNIIVRPKEHVRIGSLPDPVDAAEPDAPITPVTPPASRAAAADLKPTEEAGG